MTTTTGNNVHEHEQMKRILMGLLEESRCPTAYLALIRNNKLSERFMLFSSMSD